MSLRPARVPAPAERAYDLLEPLAARDEHDDWPLLRLLAAAAAGDTVGWALGEDPGASVWLQPAVAPAEWLPFLAQVVGARLTGSMTEERRRTEIAHPTGWGAGLPASLITTARQHMHDPGRVVVRERYDPAQGAEVDAPGHVQVRVRESDVNPGETDHLTAGVVAQVPAWIVAHVEVTNNRDYDEMTATWPDYDTADAANVDYSDLLTIEDT